MKRSFLAALSLFLCSPLLLGQVNLVLTIRNPMPSQLSLWERDRTLIQAVFVNTGARAFQDVRISFTIKNLDNGKQVAQSKDNQADVPRFNLGTGAVTRYTPDLYNANAVSVDASIKNSVTASNMLPEGTYQLCVRLLLPDGSNILTAGEVCGTFTVIIPDPPRLISPAQGDSLSPLSPPTFTWTPVFVSPGVQAHYRLTIAPILQGQIPRDALERNETLFNQTVPVSSFFYSPNNPAFTLFPTATGYAWQVQAVDDQGVPVTRNSGKSEIFTFTPGKVVPPIIVKILPDTLILDEFAIAVESWDVKSKSLNPLLPSGIGRIHFSCTSIVHFPWEGIELVPKNFSVVSTIHDSLSQVDLPEAHTIKMDAKVGDKILLNVPKRSSVVEQLLDRNVLIDFFKKKPPTGIRVEFHDVRWVGPVKKTVLLTEGVATYPTLPPVPALPAEVPISAGCVLAIDSLTITPLTAVVKGSIELPTCLVSALHCTRASLALPPTKITHDCHLYRELPDSTYGPFYVGETGLQISGTGYTLDFSPSLSDGSVSPPLPAGWEGVVLRRGETPAPPTDTVISNRGYVKAKYRFTNGLVTVTGLAARFDLQSPFVFRTLEPYDYLVNIPPAGGYLTVGACGITGGEFKSGRIRLPFLAIRNTTGAPVEATYATLEVHPDMDLYGEVKVYGGFVWGEFMKTAGQPRFYQLDPDPTSAPVTGYFYLCARQLNPYYPVSGSVFTTPVLYPPNTQLQALGIQGVTIPEIGRRKFTIWTQDVPGHLLFNRKLEFPAEALLSSWMNFIGTGVHTEIRIVQSPDLPDTTYLGPTWSTNPRYLGETPLKTSFRYISQNKSRIMRIQFVESATWDSDFNGQIFLRGPVNNAVRFTKLMFTSTANAGGAQLDLSSPLTMTYWGVQVVPKDSTKSAGVVCVKLGVIYLTAAGIWEPRHFDRPFYLTWGEIKASGNLGRLFFDYNNVGQKFDGFPYTPAAVVLSPYNPMAPGDSGYVHTFGSLAVNFFGAKAMSIVDWNSPNRSMTPYLNRTVRVLKTANPVTGITGVSDLHWVRDWAGGVSTLDFTLSYDSLAQEGFVGPGSVALLKMITFSSGLSANINVKAERSCFSILQEAYSSINLGPLATASSIGKLWGCGCIVGESLDRIAVGGELSTSAGVGASILARGAGDVSVVIGYAPTRVVSMFAGDMFVVILTNNAEVIGYTTFTIDIGNAYVEGYMKGILKLDDIAAGISGQGEFDWHIGLDYESIQGRVAVSMYEMGWPAAGAGVESGIFFGINAPKDRAWVMDGINGRFGLNKAGLPARLTGFYSYVSFSASVSYYIVSGGFQAYAGVGAFVGTGAPVTGFGFGVIGNVGIYIWGKILGGLVSADAWGNLQVIAGVPPAFEGAIGLDACVLWVFCGGVTVHGGFNASQGFYIY